MQLNKRKKKKNYPLKSLLDQSPSSPPETTLSFSAPLAHMHYYYSLSLFAQMCASDIRVQVFTREKDIAKHYRVRNNGLALKQDVGLQTDRERHT